MIFDTNRALALAQDYFNDPKPSARRVEPAHAPELPRFANVDSVVEELRPAEPVFCLSPAALEKSVARFKSFPGRVLYAVKCNAHPTVLSRLYDAGIRDFDVASLQEVRLIDSLFGKSAGMYFNNPAKTRPAIRSASHEHGIRFFTIDHESELRKISSEVDRDDEIVVAVRISTNSRDARYALSTKFGASPDETVDLLRMVHKAGFRSGLSFHVGSQCLSPEAFSSALLACKRTLDRAGVPISVLNVGGGFPAPYPGDEVAILEQYFASIIFGGHWLQSLPGCMLMCEPGRSLVATAGSVVAQVLVRKEGSVYLNDGIFGGLQELRHPKERRPARLIRIGSKSSAETVPFRVFGPTCDSDDVLGAPLALPADVREGDWIEIGMMGAYSLSMRTEFNGFTLDKIVEVGE